MAHKKPVTLTLAQAPRIVQWAIAFHAWLLTWLPESYPDREVIAVTFEEQCLEAYQVGLGWWMSVMIWGWSDVGVTANITQLNALWQKISLKNITAHTDNDDEPKDIPPLILGFSLSLIFIFSMSLIFSLSLIFVFSLIIIIISISLIISISIIIRKKRNL